MILCILLPLSPSCGRDLPRRQGLSLCKFYKFRCRLLVQLSASVWAVPEGISVYASPLPSSSGMKSKIVSCLFNSALAFCLLIP